jgi:hypothetical protein
LLERNEKVLAGIFVILVVLHVWIFFEANSLAFSQKNQPYVFYVYLQASSEIWNSPDKVYGRWSTSQLDFYWQEWCWYGSKYNYTPMFAAFLSPLSGIYPPTARLIWEIISVSAVIVAGYLGLRIFRGFKTRLFFLIMIFIMPLPVFTWQSLPQHWLPQRLTMWLSPAYFAEYYWGETNAVIMLCGLLAFYCLKIDKITIPFIKGPLPVPGYVLSSLFLSLGSFKLTAVPFIFPFWILLLLKSKNPMKTFMFFILFMLLFNFSIFIHPNLLIDFFNVIFHCSGNQPFLYFTQIHDYVWFYTMPLAGLYFLNYPETEEKEDYEIAQKEK